MASGLTNGDGIDDPAEKNRFTGCKVYTRRVFKCQKKTSSPSTTTAPVETITETTTDALNNATRAVIVNEQQQNCDDDNGSVQVPSKIMAPGDLNSDKQPVVSQSNDLSDDLPSLSQQTVLPTTRDADVEAVKHGSENNETNMDSRSKQDLIELKNKLKSQLDVVRSVAKQIEVREGEVVEFNRFHPAMNVSVNNKLTRAHSEVGIPRESFRHSRPLNQLSMSALENNQAVVNEHVEKEKRTPKANQFYRNSEFLLAKDKFPPLESNKKFKANRKKHNRADVGQGFGPSSKIFKRCSALLEKLMKHKHGWVFNTPVDAKTLGLHDYFVIIKRPMDLGTIKSRLNDNWYKSPKEFAEDVRLTFYNAMTYNPKGQDVHVMAEQLSNVFEDKWGTLEADYDREMRFSTIYDTTLQTPTARKTNYFPTPAHLDMRNILDRSDSMAPRLMSITPSSRTPAPKKPKAKDLDKREMTYDEKQKLSTNLSNLPAEKLDVIIEIMKKRSSAILQRDDEIEVDIDSVDTETLWELDRFVTNYKKSLSKNKRKAELALQRAQAERKIQKIPDQAMVEAPKESTAERNVSSSVPVEAERESRSSSSSSSSSDSGSSSSDSDSDSSSASGSDAGGSQ